MLTKRLLRRPNRRQILLPHQPRHVDQRPTKKRDPTNSQIQDNGQSSQSVCCAMSRGVRQLRIHDPDRAGAICASEGSLERDSATESDHGGTNRKDNGRNEEEGRRVISFFSSSWNVYTCRSLRCYIKDSHLSRVINDLMVIRNPCHDFTRGLKTSTLWAIE